MGIEKEEETKTTKKSGKFPWPEERHVTYNIHVEQPDNFVYDVLKAVEVGALFVLASKLFDELF